MSAKSAQLWVRVARLMDMKKVRSAFTDVLGDGQAAWDQSQNADPARRTTVAEDILLRLWSGGRPFASEWFVACVNRDARVFKKSIDRKIGSWFKKELANSPYQATDDKEVRRLAMGLLSSPVEDGDWDEAALQAIAASASQRPPEPALAEISEL